MNSFSKGNCEFFEIHINPSHSELVVFNHKTMKFTTYIYTQYFINGNMDILTVVDPPHFSSQDASLKKEICVNGSPVSSFDSSDDIDVKIHGGVFEISRNGIKTGYVKKYRGSWKYYSAIKKSVKH